MISPEHGVRRKWAVVFYWVGVVLTAACIFLILIGRSEKLHRLEHNNFPLSWMFAGFAILAFAIAEFSQPGKGNRSKPDKR